MSEYKSPTYKILNVLKTGRDKWKEKTLNAKYENKKLKQQLKYCHQKIEALTEELNQLKASQKKIKE